VYWCCAHLRPRQERLAIHCLELGGYQVYLPRLREQRVSYGRKIETRPPLFPGYAFVAIEARWHAVRWGVGIIGLIMAGAAPARVPDGVIAELRSRERGGLVELPRQPALRPGGRVRIAHGPLQGCVGLVAGMRAGERVEILLALLGRVVLTKDAIEVV